MKDNPTTVESKPRKQVLVPPGKPKPKNEDAFVTPKGKDIEIKLDPVFGFYFICFTQGGTLPKELEGRFTEYFRAEHEVEKYLKSYWKGR